MRIEKYQNEPDQGRSYYENNMAHIVSRDLELQDEDQIKEGFEVQEGLIAIVAAGALTFIVQYLSGYIQIKSGGGGH